jgi:hypothetical protein
MHKVGRPPVLRPAALALAVYALVVLVGPGLLHAATCHNHPTPHCLVCASVEAVSSIAEPFHETAGDLTDAGTVAVIGTPTKGQAPARPEGDRAPPVSC